MRRRVSQRDPNETTDDLVTLGEQDERVRRAMRGKHAHTHNISSSDPIPDLTSGKGVASNARLLAWIGM
jgi:hypothetical protein